MREFGGTGSPGVTADLVVSRFSIINYFVAGGVLIMYGCEACGLGHGAFFGGWCLSLQSCGMGGRSCRRRRWSPHCGNQEY